MKAMFVVMVIAVLIAATVSSSFAFSNWPYPGRKAAPSQTHYAMAANSDVQAARTVPGSDNSKQYMKGLTPEQRTELDREYQRIPQLAPDSLYPDGVRYYSGN